MNIKLKYRKLIFGKIILSTLTLLCNPTLSNAQMLFPITGDTVLKPDTNNVVRNVYADSIVYFYYFDKVHSKLRTKYVYSLDKSDGREILSVRAFCFSGQKVFEETYKNYNRVLKTPDTNFAISKLFIAYNGRETDPLITDTDEPFRQYSRVGASLHWYCNGNRRDSTWYFPTKKFVKYQSTGGGKTIRYKKNITEQRGVGYSWYESGNIAEEWHYQNGKVISRLVYMDSKDQRFSSKYIVAKDKNSKGTTDLMCHYFPNGNLEDSAVSDSKSNKNLEHYEFYENGTKRQVRIDRPDFIVFESYDSMGRPSKIERKALYKDKWYECTKWWFDNGQLADSRESQQFYLLHPEYGSLPDSVLYVEESYYSNGTRSFYKYTLKNGDTYSFVYRKNGTLERRVFFNSKKLGTETEYDENGAVTNQKNIDLNKQ